MDIYSFINSRDIAAHCREIQKEWNSFEMAVLVGRSRRTMAEKHAAWHELIVDYPDMPMPRYREHTSNVSLHKKLAEYIEFEKRIFELFKTPEQGELYTHSVYKLNTAHDSQNIFTTFEKALADVFDTFNREEIKHVYIRKIFADDDSSCMSAIYNCEGNLCHINAWGTAVRKWFSEAEYGEDHLAEIYNLFHDYFYVCIPTPFKRGDILCLHNQYIQLSFRDEICVLDYLDVDVPERLEYLMENGDGSDLLGSGYSLDESAVLIREDIVEHDLYEYYRGKLKGKARTLYFVSMYLKKIISLPELMAMQNRILLQHTFENIHSRNSLIELQTEYDLSLAEGNKVIGCSCPKCSGKKKSNRQTVP